MGFNNDGNAKDASKRAGFTISSVFWNMLGSVMVAGASFILLMFVTRTVGTEVGGVFSLAYTTAQILLTIGKFGVRSYQSTDVNNVISAGTYFYTRIWFSVLMILADVIFCVLNGFNAYRTEVFILVAFIKVIDAIEDVFHGEWQRRGRLDRAGQMLFFRNVLTIAVFGVCMYLTYDLRMTCLITSIVSICACFVMNLLGTKGIVRVDISHSLVECRMLLKECMPLFVGTFLSLFIYNVPKYIIGFTLSDELVAVYTIIFMPTFVINMLCDIVFKPMLTMFAIWWNEGDAKALKNVVIKLLGGVIILTVIATVFAHFIGAYLLGLIYKADIISYKVELVALMAAGGFAAIVYLLYNVLTAMRKQGFVLLAYSLTAVLITVLAYVLTRNMQLMGSAIAYLISEIFNFSVMLVMVFYLIDQKNRNNLDKES